jgi:hypothetical protein
LSKLYAEKTQASQAAASRLGMAAFFRAWKGGSFSTTSYCILLEKQSVLAGLLLLYEAENYEHGRESFPVRFSRSMKEVIHETVTCKLFTKEEGGKTDDLLWKVSVCSLPYFYAPVSQRPAGFSRQYVG